MDFEGLSEEMKATDLHTDLTASEVKRLLWYDLEAGIFTWREKPHKDFRKKVGDVAGGSHRTGYWSIQINRRHYLAHRLAWLYVHGEWPSEFIDHIDGDKSNNRISNLRVATNSQNKGNGRIYASNTTGLRGVTKQGNKWKAQIVHNRKNVYLGCFPSKEEAYDAFRKAEKELRADFSAAA